MLDTIRPLEILMSKIYLKYIPIHIHNFEHTSCHGAHTREEQEHADEDVNSNNNI